MRVLLADDHPLVLGGLRALLRSEPGVEVVAAAPDGAIALELIRAHEPHIAVLDINMPRLSGLDVLEALERDGLATRAVFLTGTASDEQIATAVERGAWGVLLKEHALDTLVQCLRIVAAGQRWLPEEVVAPAIRRATERREKDIQLARVLTAREYEIAGLVAQGLSNKHRDYREFRVWVGHDRDEGAQPCPDAKNRVFRTPSWTSFWLGPTQRQLLTRMGFWTS